MAETLRVSCVDACVERIRGWTGTDLRVAAPLGLGRSAWRHHAGCVGM
jgi:hypothetical protein